MRANSLGLHDLVRGLLREGMRKMPTSVGGSRPTSSACSTVSLAMRGVHFRFFQHLSVSKQGQVMCRYSSAG